MSQHNCQQLNGLLSAYIENELDPTTTLRVAEQLEQCAKCRQEFQQLNKVTALIQRAFNSDQEKDPTITTRATAINQRVRAQLLAEVQPVETAPGQPTTSAGVTTLSSRFYWLKRLALTATILIALGFIGLVTLIYRADLSGPLLSAVVRNHHLCDVMLHSGVSRFTGLPSEKFRQQFNITAPDLSKSGLTFDVGHPCRVYRARFMHMMYLKDQRPISIYYGSEEAVGKLRESAGPVEPNKIYTAENKAMLVSAFAPKQDRLWIVVGELSPQEMKAVTTELQDRINEQNASLIKED